MPQQLFASPDVDWRGVWIWHEDDPPEKNIYSYFRKTFDVASLPERSMLHITADTQYMLWVNGREVGRGPIFCDPRRQSYDSYDVGGLVQQGKNVIAVLGYYYGEGVVDGARRRNQPGATGTHMRSMHESMPGLLCQLEMSAGVERTRVVSDVSWRSRQAGSWHTDVAKIDDTTYSEIYFSEMEPGEWKDASFDDSSWDGVKVRTGMLGMVTGGMLGGAVTSLERVHERVWPWLMLEPRDVPHLRKREIAPKALVTVGEVIETETWANENVALRMALEHILDPKFTSVRTPESLVARRKAEIVPFDNSISYDDFQGIRSATVILDMGEIMNGRVRFDVECPSGAIIDVAHGQRLLENGRPEIYSSRISSADRYVAKEGRQQWTTFGYRHFRYIQMTFRNLSAPLAIHDLDAVAVENPAELVGDFTCSDEVVNWTWQAGVRSTKLNLHEQCECCHNRERAQLSFDVVYNIPGAMTAFGDVPAVRRYIRNMLRAQTVYGTLTHTPARTYEQGMLVAGAGEAVMDVLWKHYERFGDRELLEEAYVPVRRHIEFQEHFRGRDGLICDQPLLVLQDWAEVDGEGKGKLLTLNARYARGLEIASQVARETADKTMAEKWLGQFRETVGSIKDKFWDDAKGAYVDYISPDDRIGEHVSEHGNYMLMAWGYVEEERGRRIVDYLRDPGLEIGQVSPLQMNFLIDGLLNYGHTEYALKVMKQRYGRMRKAGLDGLAETWNLYGSRVWATRGWRMFTSRNVALLSGPLHGLSRYVLGVSEEMPGCGRIRIAPQPGGLAWARGAVPTGKGNVTVSWRRDENLFRVECDLPEGIEGTVVLPLKADELSSVTVNHRASAPVGTDKTGRPVIPASGRTLIEALPRITDPQQAETAR